MTVIDLNSDLGESFGPWRMGRDAEMLDIVSSANVACGFHAGDPSEMARTVALCRDKGVAVGAHPGFHDLEGFGRRRILGLTRGELTAMMLYQIGALDAIARAEGIRLSHVKPHGALNNMASEDRALADVLVAAIRLADPALPVLAIAATALEAAARADDGPAISEVFADRGYNDDGTLVARGTESAMIEDPEAAAENVLRMIGEQAVTSVNGVKVPVRPESVCVHGDGPAAVAMAAHIRTRLEAAGIVVAAPGRGG
ncbi:LamB/YcsF family protein [Maritimibacter sp. 55A14]|uniref:LamB/YcsF family protein n=1 Tax=Maritimibacter sp. 55A14 TaxID=2174844 RepID=UPI000D60E1A7|nr:5-oxoprolinase subunit PxpA [Maritimibacter sp. 55A14]PWE30688.1 LamB/YcsF family protein [Maritimibacter sp. 55A14]